MKNIWDIDIFEASKLDGADGVIMVSDGKATLTSGDIIYALDELALLKSTGNTLEGSVFKASLSKKVQIPP